MGITEEERKTRTSVHPTLFLWLTLAAVVGIIAMATSAFTLFAEKNDVRSVACDNARAVYIQDEYLVYRTRQNLTHLSPKAIKEAVSFYHALEDIIPVGRCNENRTVLRDEAQLFIRNAIKSQSK